jgi:cell wall-associated NlpC family hydrolase
MCGSRLRLSRTLVLAAGLLLCASVLAGTASGDTLLQEKQAQYARVRAQVRKLDSHIELLTERYDQVRWHLHVLRREIRVATARLNAEEAELKRQQQNLAQLVIEQYKGGDPKTLEIVFGSSTLSQITSGMDLDRQVDAAVSDTVAAIDAARAAIAHQRELLVIDRQASRVAKLRLAQKRRQIRHQLRRRRRLEKELGQQVKVIEAADQIGQGQLALEAHKWLEHDLKADAADPGQALRDQIALDALKQIGVPYVWGGASPDGGFDCSGLVMWLWAQHGYTIPHFAASQFHMGPVWIQDQAQLRPGDLVFFHKLGHVAIYIGEGYVVHAPHTGDFVRIAKLSRGWFQDTYVGATQPGPA